LFDTNGNPYPFIDVDSTQTFQTIDGFGFTLTGGSAYVIDQMNTVGKAALLKELFGNDSSSIGISYIRLSIGSSDLNASVFSYDDIALDTNLTHFNFGPDTTDLIPILKQIIAINPSIKIIAAPWSAPVWMKDNNSSSAGSLLPVYYNVYAQYFVKYIQQMKLQGITIDAVTPQNEPLNPNNNPSLVMYANQEANFIKNNLGPAFQSANISTKIVVYDHNCDRPDYPDSILNDATANAYVNGSAFHLYAGDISVLSQVHNLYPNKQLYFTEQYTASTGDFAGDLKWHLKNVIIGSLRNWSRTALEWNLANDASYGPHTNGGCTTCKGAVTINNSSVTRNVGYYIVANASKFVPAGSTRIASTITATLNTVAVITPSGKKVLIVENDDQAQAAFNIRFNGKWVTATLPDGAVGTFVW
ncbi:MAG TPA: glycoside hydrolase family 30 beta sandwich domain-containing protein, partial [Puia sp.]|nr:glycoside hydrolase family 30 beta sandwich domain-containing protein [Puia sp.]